MKLELYKNMEKAVESLLNIEESFKALPNLNLDSFKKEDTAIIFVDVIEGFVNEGALSSPRALNILPYVEQLSKAEGFKKLYFADCHPADASEFNSYPPHCINTTNEPALVKELAFNKDVDTLVEKNSTNGFHALKFKEWLKSNKNIVNFIVVGLVTDICVMQFALTLKSYFDELNGIAKIIVPIEAVETYTIDETNHNGELMNTFALYNMQMNGIKLYRM